MYLYLIDFPDVSEPPDVSLIARLTGDSDSEAKQYAMNIISRQRRNGQQPTETALSDVPQFLSEFLKDATRGAHSVTLLVAETDVLWNGPSWWVLDRRGLRSGASFRQGHLQTTACCRRTNS